MSANKYKPYVAVIPEDDANRQLVNGFLLSDAVNDRAVDLRGPAGGWSKVLEIFEEEYLDKLKTSEFCHVVMLIDFDNQLERRQHFEARIPNKVKSRVFVIGSLVEPESLKQEFNQSLEKIGSSAAAACDEDNLQYWEHPHLVHNKEEIERLMDRVKPILFQDN